MKRWLPLALAICLAAPAAAQTTYDFDSSNPTDAFIVSLFPANERNSRSEIETWAQVEHSLTGRHTIPAGDTTARDALTNVEVGNLFVNTGEYLLERCAAASAGSCTTWLRIGLWKPGDIKMTAYDPVTGPGEGWVPCDGRALSTTTYAALFAVIGNVYDTQGGVSAPGAGQFRVPNFQSIVPIGYHAGGDGDGDHGTMGEQVGEKTHVLTSDEMAAHTHTITNETAHTHRVDALEGTAGGVGAYDFFQVTQTAAAPPFDDGTGETESAGEHDHGGATGSVGSDQAHENRQLSVVVGYLIYSGV